MGHSINDLNRAVDNIIETMDERSNKKAKQLADSVQSVGLFTLLFIMPITWMGATIAIVFMFEWFFGDIMNGDEGTVIIAIIGFPFAMIAAFILIKKSKQMRESPFITMLIVWATSFVSFFIGSLING
jgi:uncharacterized membrane protein YgcG